MPSSQNRNKLDLRRAREVFFRKVVNFQKTWSSAKSFNSVHKCAFRTKSGFTDRAKRHTGRREVEEQSRRQDNPLGLEADHRGHTCPVSRGWEDVLALPRILGSATRGSSPALRFRESSHASRTPASRALQIPASPDQVGGRAEKSRLLIGYWCSHFSKSLLCQICERTRSFLISKSKMSTSWTTRATFLAFAVVRKSSCECAGVVLACEK